MRAGRYAAIDIGTVTCRMLVADVDASGLHELDREYAITNLGEGVDATGVLDARAMERVAQAVAGFQRVLQRFRTSEHPNVEMHAIATPALRSRLCPGSARRRFPLAACRATSPGKT